LPGTELSQRFHDYRQKSQNDKQRKSNDPAGREDIFWPRDGFHLSSGEGIDQGPESIPKTVVTRNCGREIIVGPGEIVHDERGGVVK
jgi:hypothetical protein